MGTQLVTERIGSVNGRVRSSMGVPQPASSTLTVAVAVISHNYGRYLGHAMSSVLQQSNKADELIVIDDSSTDNTKSVADNFGVPYYRIDKGQQYESWKKALHVTTSDVLCFLDADDVLASDYLQNGMQQFGSYDTGIVYSDLQKFGESQQLLVFGEFDKHALERENFIHAGSLVRREALVSSRALDTSMPNGMRGASDWYVWKRVCREGWKAEKQSSKYQYRIHDDNNSGQFGSQPHFVRAGLETEPVTFFIALSGRTRYWKRMSKFLDKQHWPRSQARLILMDTSGSKRFHRKVRSWALRSDYDDVRVIRTNAGERFGTADEDRRDDTVRHAVQRAVCRIYNRMAREISTEYVLTIEDDVVPPVNIAETLLEGFDPSTVSVAAPLLSRYHEGYLHWYYPKTICTTKGTGIEEVAGNGFGCTMLRGSVLKETVFTSNPAVCKGDFDGSFYMRLPNWKKKVHWGSHCIHGEQIGKVR